MNRYDDARLDAILRTFLEDRASDTGRLPDAAAVSAAIALRVPGRGRSSDRAWAVRLVWVAIIASLVLLAVGAVLVGRQQHSVQPPVRNGVIAYATERGLSGIYLVRPGEAPRQIAGGEASPNGGVCPAFSPDGTMLVYGMPAGSFALLSVDARGELVGQGRRLPYFGTESPHCPSWAPDNASLAFLDGSTLVVLSLDGPARRIEGWEEPVSAGTGAFAIDRLADRDVQWSPDGTTIAVARPSGTWLVPVDGREARRLDPGPASSVSWAPDGSAIAISRAVGGWAASIVPVSGDRPAVDLPRGSRQAVWSPTGEWIAYTSDASEVTVGRPDGSDSRVIAEYGYNVTWSPDGSQVLYQYDVGSAEYALTVSPMTGDGRATTIVGVIPISGARAFGGPGNLSWQPVHAVASIEASSPSPAQSTLMP